MKQLLVATTLALTFTCFKSVSAQENRIDFQKVKAYEVQLDDVMEIIDTVELKIKLADTEAQHALDPTEVNRLRLGIIYHETALNLSFFTNSLFKGYAQKSFEIPSDLYSEAETSKEALPFISAYRASALSLVGAETRKLKTIGEAFDLFDEAVAKYALVSYAPEFLRGSVAENLPWFFFSLKKFAKLDFQYIIDKQKENEDYANWKIMSFTYWAWANQHQGKKDRNRALEYLEKAIALDPDYEAGRERAEVLKEEMMN